MKTNLLLSLAFLTSIAFAQSSEDDLFRSYAMEIQENEFAGSTGLGRQSISSLSSRLQAFQQKLKAMEPRMDAALGRSDLPSANASVDGRAGAGSQNGDSFVEPYSPRVSQGFGVSVEAVSSRDDQRLKGQSHRGNMGVYILPFIALQGASPFDWHSGAGTGPDFSIKQKLGFSSGWRIGKRWPHFFIDADVSYYRNKFKSMVNMPWDFSGGADGYGGMVNFGGHFNPRSSVSILFGEVVNESQGNSCSLPIEISTIRMILPKS